MEHPFLAGFAIFVAWFFLTWAFAYFLEEGLGMRSKYAFSLALTITTAAAALTVWAVFGEFAAMWVGGGYILTQICLRLSGANY